MHETLHSWSRQTYGSTTSHLPWHLNLVFRNPGGHFTHVGYLVYVSLTFGTSENVLYMYVLLIQLHNTLPLIIRPAHVNPQIPPQVLCPLRLFKLHFHPLPTPLFHQPCLDRLHVPEHVCLPPLGALPNLRLSSARQPLTVPDVLPIHIFSIPTPSSISSLLPSSTILLILQRCLPIPKYILGTIITLPNPTTSSNLRPPSRWAQIPAQTVLFGWARDTDEGCAQPEAQDGFAEGGGAVAGAKCIFADGVAKR